MHLSIRDIFLPKEELLKTYFQKQAKGELNIDEQTNELEVILQALKEKAKTVDDTLEYSAEAVLKKINYQLDILQKKMLRAEKKKNAVVVARLEKLKDDLFPNGSLQERIENFIEYFLLYGDSYFDTLLKEINPLQNEFLVLEELR